MLTEFSSPEEISKTDLKTLQAIFKEEKTAKQILNAAKRAVKKRSASGDIATSDPKKNKLGLVPKATPFPIESALTLPISADTDEMSKTVVLTNRAPLVLAFAVTVIKYTMPEQPLSSRLSLAQAVVSANSRTKALSLGIESGQSAEDEGWGQGQHTVKMPGQSDFYSCGTPLFYFHAE